MARDFGDGAGGLRIAVLLQTPDDPLSAVSIAYQSLARELETQGHSLAVITPRSFPAMRVVDGRWTPIVYPFAVAAWAWHHRGEYDLLLFHSYAGWLALTLPIPGRPRAVVAFHGLEPLYHEELLAETSARGGHLSLRYRLLQQRLMPFMLRRSCRKAAAVFCLNSLERRFLVESGWAEGRTVHVLPHGIGPEFFAPRRRIERAERLLFVGNWLPMKGITYLVQAAIALMERNERVRLTCAGTVADEIAVREQFPLALRERVTVYSRVDQEALAGLYRDADVFVFPSLSEGFSRAVIEAMASGLPIVATDIAGDVLADGVNALIVPRRDWGAIVTAVERLQRDPELASRLATAAADTAQSYRRQERLQDTARILVELAAPSTVS